ncbi:MAG: HEAT repeat domain-containing protein [Isosphaeraceae bacterium]
MEAVAYYVAKARSGAVEDAFHGLQDLGTDALPAMQSAYHDEVDPIVRALIVEAIWQRRQPSTTDFLADALRDPAPPVWKQALDGLVTLASPASICALRSAWDRETNPERRAWIEEAIGQATDAVTRHAAS